MRIILVRSGAAPYTAEHVTALTNQIMRHNPEAQVFTLTDQKDTPGFCVPLMHKWPGWWSKMELFAPYNAAYRPALYIDLDSFVTGLLQEFDEGEEFFMIEDVNPKLHHPASGVMWLPTDTSEIWGDFMTNPMKNIAMTPNRGQQFYVGPFCKNLWHDKVKSYKFDGEEGMKAPILCFHGTPKPWNAGGWAQDFYEESLRDTRTETRPVSVHRTMT